MIGIRTRIFTASLALSACSDGTSSPVSFESAHVSSPFTNVAWLRESDDVVYLLDTGSPRTQVVPSAVGLADEAFAEVTWDDPFGFNVERRLVLASGEFPPFLLAVPGFAGIVGADLIRQRPVLYDSLGQRLVIGRSSAEQIMDEHEVKAGRAVAMQVLGGSETCFEAGCIGWDANRMIVPVSLDGTETWGIVDTGMGNVTVSEEFFGRHLADGTQLSFQVEDLVDPEFTEAAPVVMTSLLAESLIVGGVEETRVRVDVPPRAAGLDAALSRLSVEVGVKVEVLLGNSFFARFLTQFDYDNEELRLFRYLDQDRDAGRFEGGSVFRAETIGGLGFSDAPIGGTYDGRCLYAVRTVIDGEGDRLGLASADNCFLSIAGYSGDDPARFDELAAHLNALALGAEVAVDVDMGGAVETFTLHVQRHLPS